jgi:hypothetical protein
MTTASSSSQINERYGDVQHLRRAAGFKLVSFRRLSPVFGNRKSLAIST